MISGEVDDVQLVAGAGGLRRDEQRRRGLGGIAGNLAAENWAVLKVHVDDAQADSGHVGKVAVEVEGVGCSVVARLISIGCVEEEEPVCA